MPDTSLVNHNTFRAVSCLAPAPAPRSLPHVLQLTTVYAVEAVSSHMALPMSVKGTHWFAAHTLGLARRTCHDASSAPNCKNVCHRFVICLPRAAAKRGCIPVPECHPSSSAARAWRRAVHPSLGRQGTSGAHCAWSPTNLCRMPCGGARCGACSRRKQHVLSMPCNTYVGFNQVGVCYDRRPTTLCTSLSLLLYGFGKARAFHVVQAAQEREGPHLPRSKR